jgi:hypothetical protein
MRGRGRLSAPTVPAQLATAGEVAEPPANALVSSRSASTQTTGDPKTLREFSNPTDTWPKDDEVRERLEAQPLYNWVNQRRIRMLLEACEEQMANTNKSEQLPLPEKLTIEHALPQTWRGHWELPDGADEEEATAERDARVDRLGNLTLVTSGLNSSLSNSK